MFYRANCKRKSISNKAAKNNDIAEWTRETLMKTVHGRTGKQVLKVTTTYTITLRKVYNGSKTTHVEVVKRNINVTPGPPSEAEIAKAKAQLKLASLSEVDSVNAKLLNLAAASGSASRRSKLLRA